MAEQRKASRRKKNQDILTRSFASRFKLCFAPPDYRTLIRQLVGYFPRKGQKLLRFVLEKKE